jgi:CheY-like chemotaxis protein
MIRKLMAFSRREHLDIRQLDLADVTDDLAPMLTRLLPENIEVIVIRGNGPAMIRADRGAVEQIALNLATNARDAMPDGGTLRIETYATTIDGESGAGHRMGETSEYICLAVSDTGLGIDDAVRTKIFEPFFTTKPPGEGTGLGMSMVYGLIKQHGGLIKVDSEPRRGTTVQVCFPADPSRTRPGATPQAAREVRGGSETILLVEDEEAIRRASQRVLQHFGYEVRVAADGEEALALLSDPNVPVDLVITDVVMPKLGGRKLYDAAQKAGYDVRFIFSSGYAARDMRDGVELDPRLPFLRKPWMVADLLARVREVLDEPREKTAMIAVGPRAIVASRCNEVGIE